MDVGFVALSGGAGRRVQRRRAVSERVRMGVEFQKYHGIGNDFILVDNMKSSDTLLTADESVKVCDRHFGVGADGVIFMMPPVNDDSDFSMRIYNSDGSEPEMCGNGIRCLARFAREVLDSEKTVYKIDTLAGLIVPEIAGDMVRVDMGEPELNPAKIPSLLTPNPDTKEAAYNVNGIDWQVVPIGTGNPHAVVFVDEEQFKALDENLEAVGPLYENHETFPARTNTEFIYVKSPEEIDFLVWERGAGRTLACGTGACASVVACSLTGRTGREVAVNLPGGRLDIEWSEDNHMYMTGPAELVYAGEIRQ
ncbi:hypothetical protein NDN08_001667 [Rhodosorus marinus]|uniref:diaminopimelate epimerase n=1 Tax=Rhodosorus marinus TaxID=101924 RepID=A0AAV8UVP2_9RHOD|nr:hypothetical protein NDN08_001667 [Rhodosorus marinus]